MKLQTLKISKELHQRIKIYCAQNNKKMLLLVENILQKEINKLEKKNDNLQNNKFNK